MNIPKKVKQILLYSENLNTKNLKYIKKEIQDIINFLEKNNIKYQPLYEFSTLIDDIDILKKEITSRLKSWEHNIQNMWTASHIQQSLKKEGK